MANNEQKSILEVFGEKSEDGDKVKGLLLNALMRNSYENGGRVPKFKGGGIFGFGKKKQPEKDEALIALEDILSGGYELKEGEHEFPYGRNVASGEIYPDGSNLIRTIAKFSTPEGERYYPGEGKSRSNSLANEFAMIDAAQRAFHSPADSITTDQLAKLKELGLFGEE